MIGASAGKNKNQKTRGSKKGIFCEGKEDWNYGCREFGRRNFGILHFKLANFQTGVIYLW